MKRGWFPITWLLLLAVFAALTQSQPVVGLTGLGIVLIVAAVTVELGADRIWKQYNAAWKKSKGKLAKPREAYRVINVYILWPLIFVLGILSLWAAIRLG